MCWKVGLTEQHTRIGLPVLLSVRPSSRQARRTAPPDINGVNALAFGTLFSSQGASADPKGLQEDGVARPTMVGTQAEGVNRTVAPTQRFCGSRKAYQRRRRSNGRSSRDGKIPVWRDRSGSVYVRRKRERPENLASFERVHRIAASVGSEGAELAREARRDTPPVWMGTPPRRRDDR